MINIYVWTKEGRKLYKNKRIIGFGVGFLLRFFKIV